jgi:uncharacterized membrane protein
MKKKFSNKELYHMGENRANYKWGIFYYNPLDPRFYVRKRSGLGYTFNFASPYALLILAAIVLFSLFFGSR